MQHNKKRFLYSVRRQRITLRGRQASVVTQLLEAMVNVGTNTNWETDGNENELVVDCLTVTCKHLQMQKIMRTWYFASQSFQTYTGVYTQISGTM